MTLLSLTLKARHSTLLHPTFSLPARLLPHTTTTSRCRLPWCAARRSAARPSPSALPASRCRPSAPLGWGHSPPMTVLTAPQAAMRRGSTPAAATLTQPLLPQPPSPLPPSQRLPATTLSSTSCTLRRPPSQARASTKFVVQAYKVTLKTPTGEQVRVFCHFPLELLPSRSAASLWWWLGPLRAASIMHCPAVHPTCADH